MFLAEHPQALWVKTVAECLEQLREVWDEVHLDHDLGGKTFVDTSSEDSGMQVIRWLCQEPRVHLRETAFLVHTHNAAAGLLMVLEMRRSGYQAEFRPFALDLVRLLSHNESPETAIAATTPCPTHRRTTFRWLGWMSTCWGFLRHQRPDSLPEKE
jgi:hypothetical protein